MTPLAGLAAAVVVAGAILAVTSRDSRLALAALAVVLLASPFAGDPLPGLVALAARTSASLLGLYVTWLVVRAGPATLRASLVGVPAQILAGVAGLVAGWSAASGAADVLGSPPASPAAVGAAVALAVLAGAPLADVRDPFRLGVGLVLLAAAASLAAAGLAGAPGAIDQLVGGCLGLGALGCQATLVRTASPER